jgi:hypothetical protein
LVCQSNHPQNPNALHHIPNPQPLLLFLDYISLKGYILQ